MTNKPDDVSEGDKVARSETADAIDRGDGPEGAVIAAIMDLARIRGGGASISPTEVAHALADRAGLGGDAPAWRTYLPSVRRAAMDLARTGKIDILRKGKAIAPEAARGVIRLRLRADQEEI
ncbi:MAG: DUF3253 domain-containing protein [Acidiphilium sp.]|nr:DUF3253 domain-containing protein [Acidiphilium sp.]MDD4935271.1 DUF3253 domain-containing protein [Acidiphilium sp.]